MKRRSASLSQTHLITDILQAAELRHDLAPAILADTAENPAAATDQDRERIASRLQELAADAVDRAAQSAADATRTVFDAQQHADREGAVEQARDDLARTFAAAAQAGQTAPTSSESASQWLDALEELLPAAIAADRAAAAATARTAAADQRAATRRRPADIEGLLG